MEAFPSRAKSSNTQNFRMRSSYVIYMVSMRFYASDAQSWNALNPSKRSSVWFSCLSLTLSLEYIHVHSTFILSLSLSLFIILDTLFRYWQTNTIRNLVTNWKFDGTAGFRGTMSCGFVEKAESNRWCVERFRKVRQLRPRNRIGLSEFKKSMNV